MMNVVDQFATKGTPIKCAPFGEGHINSTYLVETDENEKYTLQKINHHVFKDVDKLMENMCAVTKMLLENTSNKDNAIVLIPTKDGKNYLKLDDDTYWRLSRYVEGEVFQECETAEDFYNVAKAFGEFQQKLAKFPAGTLHYTIPNFHNTVDRYRQFKEVYEANRMGRNEGAMKEIQFVLDRENIADALTSLLDQGAIPLRVTHNDTKFNNVLFDNKTRKPICIIDLDTVMPGSALFDYGDAVRCGAATAAEDEKDLDKMELDLVKFEAFTKGFIEACPDLTKLEIQMMPMGVKVIALELGMRFLTDHLDGDRYFAIHREGHNLDRARTQLKLVADIEKKWDAMNAIIAKYL